MWRAAPEWTPEHSLPFRYFLHARANMRVKAMYSGAEGVGRDRRANSFGHLRNESEVGVARWTTKQGQETREAIKKAQVDLRQELGHEPNAREISERIGVHVSAVRKKMTELGVSTTTEASTFSVGDFLDTFGPDFMQAEDRIDSIMMAYHHGEIRKAVAEMEEPWKSYCYMRFWEGKTDSEVSRELPGWHKHLLYREVKPMLRKRLAHLVDA
jgi:hypothetical protein